MLQVFNTTDLVIVESKCSQVNQSIESRSVFNNIIMKISRNVISVRYENHVIITYDMKANNDVNFWQGSRFSITEIELL